MVADGTYLGSLLADGDVAAVAAFPDLYAALFKGLLLLHVAQELAVALLVRLLDGRNAAELRRQLREALFLGLGRHALVHVGPLVVLALRGVEQVLLDSPKLAQLLEPELCVLFLVVSRFQKQLRDLLVSGLLGDRREIGILVSRL